MCGILGIAFVSDPDVISKLPQALDSIAHRGPDGQGYWSSDDIFLLHRRLAIIDTSAAGHQPMVSQETGSVLIYNGEIYNYLEIRENLAAMGVAFSTHSDTEVLLKTLDIHGVSAIPSLNGMWSFAPWDRRSRRLLLCRDRFGVKPLYYAYVAGGVAFASEPKALIALDPDLAEIDQETLNNFFVRSASFDGSNSFFKRIKCLPPGHYTVLTSEQRDVRPVRYWNYPAAESCELAHSGRSLQEEFQSLFESAVELRLRSDVPVGLTLSGGLDSTAILSRAGPAAGIGLRGFCATFGDEPGERYWALMATDKANMALDEVNADGSDWLETVRKITWHMDAPSSYAPTYALWKICEHVKRLGVSVLIEGQGADELFGGYVSHGAQMVWDRLSCGQIVDGCRMASDLRHAFGLSQLLNWIVRTPVNEHYLNWQSQFGRGRLLSLGMESASTKIALPALRNIFELLQYDHAHAVLPGLLQYSDAISMAHGVESRLPFMDYRIVEWVFRSRPELSQSGFTKLPIRSLIDSGPFGALARRRDKNGFSMPTSIWMERNRDNIREQITENAQSKLWNHISRKKVASMLKNSSNDWSSSHILKIITFHYFLHNYD